MAAALAIVAVILALTALCLFRAGSLPAHSLTINTVLYE
jgi:hypothetical protein